MQENMKPNFFDPDFQEWAFGKLTLSCEEAKRNWLHKDKVELTHYLHIHFDFPKMWDLWIEDKETTNDLPESNESVDELVRESYQLRMYDETLCPKCHKKCPNCSSN